MKLVEMNYKEILKCNKKENKHETIEDSCVSRHRT